MAKKPTKHWPIDQTTGPMTVTAIERHPSPLRDETIGIEVAIFDGLYEERQLQRCARSFLNLFGASELRLTLVPFTKPTETAVDPENSPMGSC